jgi:hypothetical protein
MWYLCENRLETYGVKFLDNLLLFIYCGLFNDAVGTSESVFSSGEIISE